MHPTKWACNFGTFFKEIYRNGTSHHSSPFMPILPRHVTLNGSYMISCAFVGPDLHRASGHTETQSIPQRVRVSADSQRMRECICHSAFTKIAPFSSTLYLFLSRALSPWLPHHLLATRHFSAINTRIAERKKLNAINQLI